jgi:hypothetical protein
MNSWLNEDDIDALKHYYFVPVQLKPKYDGSDSEVNHHLIRQFKCSRSLIFDYLAPSDVRINILRSTTHHDHMTLLTTEVQ